MATTTNKRKSPAASRSTSSSKAKSTKSSGAAASKAREETFVQRRANKRRVYSICFLFLGIFSIISYFGATGQFINLFSSLLKGLFGWGYYAVPPVLLLTAAIFGFHRNRPLRFRTVCALLIPIPLGAVLHLFFCADTYKMSFGMIVELWKSGSLLLSGGAVSGFLSELFTYLFSRIGAAIVLICSTAFLLLIAVNRTIPGIVDAIRRRLRQQQKQEVPAYVPQEVSAPKPEAPRRRASPIDIPLDEPAQGQARSPIQPEETLKSKKRGGLFNEKPNVQTPDEVLSDIGPEVHHETVTHSEDIPVDISFMEKKKPDKAPEVPVKPIEKIIETVPAEVHKPEVRTEPDKQPPAYEYPPMDLLAKNSSLGRSDGAEEVRLNIERLTAAFKNFGVKVRVSSYTRGPTVTRYEAELEAGVKLASLTNLADDIALSLGASGVRIAAMPNKISTVGIEVPNKVVSKVLLRDIIDTPEFKNASSRLAFAIGKNIGGEAIVGDIAKLPHMLVAGTTGSGKSVCLNSLILSILYKATPEEVRFIMIDPKMVEFRVYNGIPHLLVPVVTDVKKASGALQWAVVEMMKRYRIFSESECNARDLETYNRHERGKEDGKPMPQIVVIIDELADLMLTAQKEVEDSIVRVAQMGRAAGVHLVIATQSPRADVITGLMKANIPSRISLKVSSALESRIILDAGGNADKLMGNGDMLYAPSGSSKPVRIQGTWVSDSEREEVVEFVKKSGTANYSEEIIHEIEKAAEDKADSKKSAAADDSGDYDDLLVAAVEVIFETGQASVSMLQRRLKLGYSRAARIVDQMEQLKIVGQFEGSKPRQLLINRAQWAEMQFVHGTAPTGVKEENDVVEE